MSNKLVKDFENMLYELEKAERTTKNYVRDVEEFSKFNEGLDELSKSKLLAFKEHLLNNGLKKGTINHKLLSINRFLKYNNHPELVVKGFTLSKNNFLHDDELFTDVEIVSLMNEAKKRGDDRLYFTLRILAQTGARVFEVSFITYECLLRGRACVSNKGTFDREVPIPPDLCKDLLKYCKEKGISTGPVIRTRNGKAVHRSCIYRKLKALCLSLGIERKKAHPHSFRHYFAMNYLKVHGESALSTLADILGHKKIETTRIYLRKTISEVRNTMTLTSLGIRIAS